MLPTFNIRQDMKPLRALSALTLSCALSLCLVGSSNAAEGGRDALISRITRLQVNAALLVKANPAMVSAFDFVRQSNPGLSEAEWGTITDEIGSVMVERMSHPGNPMFTAYRTVLEALSDTELAKLEALLADPAYRKFSDALTSQAGQQAVIQGMIENSPWMPVALNLALRKRGLKEVH